MRRKVLSEWLDRDAEERRLFRASMERHAVAFERLMSAFDSHEKAFERHAKAFEQHEKTVVRQEQAFERHEQAFERHEQAFERHEQVHERVIEVLDARREEAGDLRTFIRDMNTRSEKVIDNLLRGNREFCRELTSKVDAKAEAMMAEMKEGREESRAHREALLALIDRLPPAPSA